LLEAVGEAGGLLATRAIGGAGPPPRPPLGHREAERLARL